MASKIFVNLPVADLPRAKAFFTALGFAFNPQFSDDTAACMIVGDDNYVMLLTRPKFAAFSGKEIVDARKQVEVLVAVSFDSRTRVDAVMAAALQAGGIEPRPPTDLGFMYQRSFDDLDGHSWEPFWMDPAAVKPQ